MTAVEGRQKNGYDSPISPLSPRSSFLRRPLLHHFAMERSPSAPAARRAAFAKLVAVDFEFLVQKLPIAFGRAKTGAGGLGRDRSIDIDFGDCAAVSRRHALLHFNAATRRFELEVVARAGLHINGQVCIAIITRVDVWYLADLGFPVWVCQFLSLRDLSSRFPSNLVSSCICPRVLHSSHQLFTLGAPAVALDSHDRIEFPCQCARAHPRDQPRAFQFLLPRDTPDRGPPPPPPSTSTASAPASASSSGASTVGIPQQLAFKGWTGAWSASERDRLQRAISFFGVFRTQRVRTEAHLVRRSLHEVDLYCRCMLTQMLTHADEVRPQE